MAQSVADILGCPLDYATSLLEAAGGNADMAIELGLSGGMMMEDTAPAPAGATNPYPHWDAIWPAPAPLPESWQEQRLDDFVTDDDDLKLIQPRNGPCGVLAVLQAELWLQQPSAANIDKEARLNAAITAILSRINATTITFADGTTAPKPDEAAKQIRTAAALVETAATTAGRTSGNPLVEGPHWLCTSDLMCLLLRGKIEAAGSFAAFDPITKRKKAFYPNNQDFKIGVLSMMEIDEGIPVADDLKFDKNVWVLHTGDHFVTMRRAENNELQVYDGLQPSGPKTTSFQLSGDLSTAKQAPDVHVETFKKKRVGQPDDIVQAKKTDSDNFKEWTFEVVPAIDDPDVQGEWDDDPNEPVYKFGELPAPTGPWRCASCYANRFKTMNFGTNKAGTEACEVCHTPRVQAMWSLWQSYTDLSPRMKRRARNMYASKMECVISTLYPKAEIVETTTTGSK
mmetsp:Transcript_556/g.1289  ORF Transcript_556/g.1289 Transcript_556/m.1289 type:complete len:456 (-) Transcript_556:2522-3889(-)